MKRSLTTPLIAFGAIFGAVVFITTVEAFFTVPDTEVPVPPEIIREELEPLPSDVPVRLRIPQLEIDAGVQEVGITAEGNMAAPSNFVDVGWYRYGTAPGVLGSAVITGHVDNAIALPGVFERLHELSIGDDVYVEAKDGGTLHFRVAEVQRYPYTHVPRSILFSRRDLPRLNLITCGGAWLPHAKSYNERLVVYTELVPD